MANFGVTTIRMFAHGVAGLTDNDVIVDIRGTRAYTDGRTVVLPAYEIRDETDFHALCGIACHEIAHVWFRSLDQLARLLQQYPPEAAGRVQRALNAVLDIADETRFERAMPRARYLFATSREQILREALARGSFFRNPPSIVPEEQLLAAAFLWTRSPARSPIRQHLKSWLRRASGLREIAKILGHAREQQRASARFSPIRSDCQWQRLMALARRLIELLDRLFPGQLGNESNGQTATVKSGAQGKETAPRNATEISDVLAPWFQTVIEWATRRALANKNSCAIPVSVDRRLTANQGGDGSIVGGSVGSYAGIGFRQNYYDQVWPAFKRLAQNLSTGPSLSHQDGFLNGGRLSRPHRAEIDGKCFRRSFWDEDSDAAVAIIFDQSYSMALRLGVFLPVGVALADALQAVPNVKVAIWRYGSSVERVPHSSDLRLGTVMGGTATHLAIHEAAAWLAPNPVRNKSVVLFTDGSPDNVTETTNEVVRLRRLGVAFLIGAIGLSELQCSRSMPGGIVFSVDPNNAGSSLHAAINRLRRRP